MTALLIGRLQIFFPNFKKEVISNFGIFLSDSIHVSSPDVRPWYIPAHRFRVPGGEGGMFAFSHCFFVKQKMLYIPKKCAFSTEFSISSASC
jgi:hypothetical protein